jgi:DHA1 family tetracycline resistance protein-like MFS transporter
MPALFLIVFVDLIGFGIIIPLLPFFGEHFRASPAEVGLLMATYSLAQFLAAPFWGRTSDRVGRKPVLLASLAGIAVSYVWLGFAESLLALFASRAVGGVMAGNIGVAFAYAADVTDPGNRAKGMGMIGAAFGLGFIVGPAIGGILAGADPSNADYRTPALVAAGLSLLAFGLAAALLKESLPEEVRARHLATPSTGRWRPFHRALSRPLVAQLLVLTFLSHFVFSGMETTFAMWSRRQFGWGPEQNGYLFAFVGVLAAAVQGGLVGRLARRLGETNLIVCGAGALALGMLLIPFAAKVPHLVAIMTIVACGFSLLSPSLTSLISLQVDAGSQGGMMGVSRSATTLARILGPGWAGLLFLYLGKDWPYFSGALMMALVTALGVHLARNRRHPGEEAWGESGRMDR